MTKEEIEYNINLYMLKQVDELTKVHLKKVTVDDVISEYKNVKYNNTKPSNYVLKEEIKKCDDCDISVRNRKIVTNLKNKITTCSVCSKVLKNDPIAGS